MKLYTIALCILVAHILVSCERNEDGNIPIESKVVVEGWIEEGDVARVLLMHSIPITKTIDSSNFLTYVIRSAMVIVSDGVEEDTLRLKTSNQYLPPFTYVGEKLIGKKGGRYKLRVKYLDRLLTAETTIPTTVPLEKVEYIRNEPSDTVGNLVANFTDPVDEQNYYQIATLLVGHDEIYVPALYGNLSDKHFASSKITFQITRGVTIFPHTNFEAHFTNNDTIYVKLRTMPKHGFDFWNGWQNEIINAQNPIFPANSSLKGNIEGGGVGIWCGYGQSVKRIIAK